MFDILLVVLACIVIALLAVLIVLQLRLAKQANATTQILEEAKALDKETLHDELDPLMKAQLTQETAINVHLESLNASTNKVEQRMDQLRDSLNSQFSSQQSLTSQRLDALNTTVINQLSAIQKNNEKKLESIRTTVDEKLSKTLKDRLELSFQQITEELEIVHRGLTQMGSLASDVGDLKHVLSNVKRRGILGEVQLSSILREILAPAQYVENAQIKEGSRENVEFALKIPTQNHSSILLPIDAKFPGDTYEVLVKALEEADVDAIALAKKALVDRIKSEAKDISSKYIAPPKTTNFAIMFLPFEGLYAEVVNQPGLIEDLQRTYNVNIAGPSTMAALLNSLQMGYQTFALQEQTTEILQVLLSIKAELPKYQKALRQAKRQIDTAGKTVEGIITTRTNQMERKLNTLSVPQQLLSDSSAEELPSASKSLEEPSEE